jgi:riboflavin kinase/FMN adenylyltransferase
MQGHKGEQMILALGQFDGVHLGHKKVIKEATEFAASRGKKVSVLCFEENYKRDILERTESASLTTDGEREALLKSLGVKKVIALPFSKMRDMEPRDFLEKIVKGEYGADAVFSGYNYHFGKGGKGDSKELKNISDHLGFEAHVVSAFKIDGKEISSSLIKKQIEAGAVDKAAEYLGRNYSLSGEVIFGNQLGRTIGFRTANVVPNELKVHPKNGVYASLCHVGGNKHKSMTNVGTRPTVAGEIKLMETNIFSFSDDIYGETIEVEFIKRIRDEVKFESLDALKEQLTRDKRKASVI